MELDPQYTAYWILLGIFAALVEFSALLKPEGEPNGTLTWNIRKLLSLTSRKRWIGRLVAIGILAWLCFHFLNPVP